MIYEVQLTHEALMDLSLLEEYLYTNESAERADVFMDEINAACKKLIRLPLRGRISRDLADCGQSDFREIYYFSYRIIYRILEKKVYIVAIIDGRRSAKYFLKNRVIHIAEGDT